MSLRNLFVDGFIPSRYIDVVAFKGATGPTGDSGDAGATGPTGSAGSGAYDPNPAFSTITLNCKSDGGRLGYIKFPFDFPANNWLPQVSEILLGQAITRDSDGQATNGIVVGVTDNVGGTTTGDMSAKRFIVGTQGIGGNALPTGTIEGTSNSVIVKPSLTSKQNFVSSLTFNSFTTSTITFSQAQTAGTAAQPAGRLLIQGQDVDLGQNDIWVQQIRLGAGNATNAQSEIVFYDAANGIRVLQTALQDRTLRVGSTINTTTGGYLLDTGINPPFFSTINNAVNMMAFFPSTTNSTIGVSTISVIPNYICSAYSSTNQTVAGANTLTLLTHNTTTTNVGGFTVLGSTITVPVGGLYEINFSIQFDTTTLGTNLASFWLRKNGANVAATGSLVSVTGQGETLGNITLIDSAAANDQYTIAIQSADANMTAAAFAASGNIPMIPSVLTNIKKIG